MRGPRLFHVATAALAAATFVACAAGDRPAPEAKGDAAASAATPVPAAPVAAARDACTLITQAEADSILGVRVTPIVREADPGQTRCYYDAGAEPGFLLTARWQGGREEMQLTRQTHPAAAGMMKQGGMDASAVTPLMALVPVAGLGDEAYFNTIDSYVLKGDVLLEFTLSELAQEHISTGHAEAPAGLKEKWTALAQRAVARL